MCCEAPVQYEGKNGNKRNLNKSLAKKVYDEQTTKYHKYLGRYQTLSLGKSAHQSECRYECERGVWYRWLFVIIIDSCFVTPVCFVFSTSDYFVVVVVVFVIWAPFAHLSFILKNTPKNAVRFRVCLCFRRSKTTLFVHSMRCSVLFSCGCYKNLTFHRLLPLLRLFCSSIFQCTTLRCPIYVFFSGATLI